MSSDASQRDVVRAVVAFSLCSASLLLINKMTLKHLPMPSFVSSLQFMCASVFVYGLKASGNAEVDDFEWRLLKPYSLYVLMFVATIYCNMKALQHANVETLIVFRSCVPIVVSGLDWAFLGRELPSRRSQLALAMLTLGAAGYVATDRQFSLHARAYAWVTAYFFIISVEMAYGKLIVGSHLKLKSMWSPTLYTNTLSVCPMLLAGLLTDETRLLRRTEWEAHGVALLLLSCVVGVAISYTGWRCRQLVSATCYTIVGVGNKMATVLVNVLIWDEHASALGIGCLVLCLLGASAYRQAPLRDTKGGGDGGGRVSDAGLDGAAAAAKEQPCPAAAAAALRRGARGPASVLLLLGLIGFGLVATPATGRTEQVDVAPARQVPYSGYQVRAIPGGGGGGAAAAADEEEEEEEEEGTAVRRKPRSAEERRTRRFGSLAKKWKKKRRDEEDEEDESDGRARQRLAQFSRLKYGD